MTTELRNGQTEVDILTRRGVPLDFGERQFRVRPRTRSHDREWLDAVFARVTSRTSAFMDSDLTIPGVIAALGEATEDMLALVVSYDETAQLPPREWIDENAYTAQITVAFTTLLEVAYPPFAVSRRLLPADRTAQIIGSLLTFVMERAVTDMSSAPTALPSPSGATTRRRKSTTPSPRASSRS